MIVASLRTLGLALLLLALPGCNSEPAKRKAAGNLLFRRGDFDGAVAEYRAAVRAAPRDSSAHILLGNALVEKDQPESARAEYRAALGLNPQARAALEGLAVLELRQHRFAEARALYETILRQEPRDAQAHAALGKLLYALGELDSAEAQLRDALVYAQNDAASLYTLGLVLARKPEPSESVAIFERLEQLTPGRAYAPYGRAVLEAAAGHAELALHWLEVALERGVDDLAAVERDPSLATLRNDPRFSRLLARARAR